SARRSMSMEAFSGKNPRYYSGFIYSILAYKIARKIYEETHFPSEVLIVSQNGGHLTNPWGCIIYTGGNSDVVRNLVLEEYNNIPQITKDFVNGQIEMI
ncbi:MAG: hypothetical protein KQA41_03885, partial [Candidatus Aenigmarchaeota archaeon]|nr:hypothetical protein [Candidatus Aenigmarchaeota archaeon]